MCSCLNDREAVQKLFRSVLNNLFAPVTATAGDNDIASVQEQEPLWYLPSAAERWSMESLSRSVSELNLLSDSDSDDSSDTAAPPPPPPPPLSSHTFGGDDVESIEQAVRVFFTCGLLFFFLDVYAFTLRFCVSNLL